MTTTGTGTGQVFAVDLRVLHADVDDLGFSTLVEQVMDLRSLVMMAHLLREGPLKGPLKGPVLRSTLEQVERRADWNTRIKSISYNSPLEIMLTLLGGTGMALAVANRILSVHDRFQQSRLLRSDVDVRVAANEAILEEIQARGGAISEDADLVRPVINRAGHALSRITAVEMDPRSQQE